MDDQQPRFIMGTIRDRRDAVEAMTRAIIQQAIAELPRLIKQREQPFWTADWRQPKRRKNSNNRSRKK